MNTFQQINAKTDAAKLNGNEANAVNGLNGFAKVGARLGGTVSFGRNAIYVHLNSDQHAFMYFHECLTDVAEGDEIIVEVISVEPGRNGGLSIHVKEAA